MKRSFLILMILALGLTAGAGRLRAQMSTSHAPTNQTELATFGGGCFWCIEAIFERLHGVISVTSGYAGGHTANPTYKDVCSGETGHAEVAKIKYDPTKITYEQLLALFWEAHDPTTLNRQGADEGTQYRSVIFYHNEAQRVAAEKSKAEAAKRFKAPIVTEIQPLTKFYEAEGYHQNYFLNNSKAPYCQAVIRPKLEKLSQKLEKK
jgi:peptide-methionine (S)-S-oxide reductase